MKINKYGDCDSEKDNSDIKVTIIIFVVEIDK